MDLTTAIQWATERRNGVLITLRRDGRAQSSDISYCVDDGRFTVSVTDDRAKTRNMRRDPRVVLHITDPATWSYLSFDATVELSPVTTSTEDPTSDALVAYYRAVAGEHPDWTDYRQAMIDQRRLVVTINPHAVVGQIT